jgi:DNA-binding NarL/FixJ family response regulator
VSPTLAEKLAYYFEENIEKPLHESLSDREYQVMLMIASGIQLQRYPKNCF